MTKKKFIIITAIFSVVSLNVLASQGYQQKNEDYRTLVQKHIQNNNHAKAAEVLHEWLKFADSQNDTISMIECYIKLANYYQFENIPDSSFYYNNKALDISILKRDTAAISGCYTNLGAETFNRGLYNLSEKYLTNAVHLDSLTNNDENLAVNLSLLSLLYGIQYIDDHSKVVQKEKSNDCRQKSLSLKGNAMSHYYAYYGQVQVFMWRQQNDSTDFYYNKFKEIASYIPISMMTISLDVDYMIYYKKYKQALKYLQDNKHLVNTNKINMRFYYEKLNYVYEKLGDYKNAHESNIKQFQLQREISDDNTLMAIANVQTEKASTIERIKREESEKSFAAEKKHLNTLIFSLVGGLILLTTMVVLIFRMWKIKRHANKQLIQKNQLLDQQNSEIEDQKNIIIGQWREVEEVNKKLIDSINYAERIQRAAVSSEKEVSELFPNNFVYYKPRDIVSGDYYRAVKCGKYSVMITADCTGHGIPGAFLSMLGISSLKEFMSTENDAENPGIVLDKMRNFIKTTLVSKDGKTIDDGMDMTICCFDFQNMELRYAIANQRIILIRQNKALRIKGDSMPVGRYIREKEHFQTFSLKLEKGDTFYMFSDGIEDQLGGDDNNGIGRKFLIRNLEAFLLEISSQPFEAQKTLLDKKITSWRGEIPQIDDMTMICIQV